MCFYICTLLILFFFITYIYYYCICFVCIPGRALETEDGSKIPFGFPLNANLTDTFKGGFGKTKYKLIIIINRPWKFDEKYEIPLNIRCSYDLNLNPPLAQTNQRQITRNIGFFGGGPISLHVSTPRSGCLIGGRLPLQVICANHSSTPVEKVKFALRQIVEYHSTKPHGHMRSECNRVMRKEAGGVEKKSEQTYEHVLEIPADLPATTCQSPIIRFRYEIQVEAKLSGLYKNLVQTIPLVLGTIPFYEDLGEAMGNVSLGFVSPLNAAIQPNQHQLAMSMPMPYSGNSSMFSEAPAYPQNPAHVPPPQYNQISSYQSPFNRHSITNSSIRSDSFVPTPSAPPLDFDSPNSTRSSICSQQQVWDTPPSYDQVFAPAQASSTPTRTVVPKRLAPQPS